MAVLLYSDERYLDHDTGPHHPERPARLVAALDGLERHGLLADLDRRAPRAATDAELGLVHPAGYISSIDRYCEAGGGSLDADTVVSSASAQVARLATGAGLAAIDALDASDATAAFLAVRPPAHHATATRSMGFCLFNTVAVTAAALAARGERVLVVAYDAHHGNGTQDIFYDRDDVAYVSWHQHPMYPGTGRVAQLGAGPGRGWTMNLPMPPFSTGDHYRRSVEELVAPLAEAHGTTWVLISAGFDAHRDDPLTDLGLTSGDFADLTSDLLSLGEPGRRIVLLEGGYDLAAVAESTAATVAAMFGTTLHPEAPSGGGPGADTVDAAARLQAAVERSPG